MSCTMGPSSTFTHHHNVMKDMRSAPIDVLTKTASDIVEQSSKDSKIFDKAAESRIPRFDFEEIKIGRVLGRGGFCVVHEIEKIRIVDADSINSEKSLTSNLFRKITLKRINKQSQANNKSTNNNNNNDDNYNGNGNNQEEGDTGSANGSDLPSNFEMDTGNFKISLSRDLVAKSTKKSQKNRSYYVMKRVSEELEQNDKISYLKGSVDMAMEAKFLSILDHPNIIELFGISRYGVAGEDFFLVLTKMNETLTKRIKTWMDIDRQCKGITGVFAGSKKKVQRLNRERLAAALDIATGVAYLHAKGIVFRDLKPDNIGYDGHGVLKLFDFGLARELKEHERTENGLYKMTGLTGAMRYMAPEVGLNQPYNETVDVYSWSMILWFMMALEPPLGFYTERMISERVFLKGYRPAIFKQWSPQIVELLKMCWTSDIATRIPMTRVCKEIRTELILVDPSCVEHYFGESLHGISESPSAMLKDDSTV